MQIKLTKHIFGDLYVPDRCFAGVFSPKQFPGYGLHDQDVANTISCPRNSPSLKELGSGKRNIVIVTDDNTRLTPLHRILPPLLNELHSAGVPERAVTFLIGLGTHRPMTQSEIQLKFGLKICSRYHIQNHAWNDPRQLVSIGECDTGFEVVINRRVLSADLLISVGSIVPHATAGFSGGGKTIMPGVCGEKTLEDTHWKALDFQMAEILGNLHNPVQRAIFSVARKVGLSFIVNTVLFGGARIFDVVAGRLDTAYERGVESCLQVYGVPIPEKSPIVIAEAFPTDIDLRQAIKAICSGDLVCEDGGVIILPADCNEGVAPQFPEFGRIGFSNPDSLYDHVNKGLFSNKLLAYTLVAIGRIISRRVKAILVSHNIDEQEADRMGMLWAPTLCDAYEIAKSIAGTTARVATLLNAGEILPLLSQSNRF